jgi:C-terminal processing protease CtpA/Prc
LWNISGSASVSGKTIEVDAATLEEAVQHFGTPLTDCDDTRFSQDEDGYFVLSRTSTTGLLAQMGLKVGDRIETINGEQILSADDAAYQVMKLFYSGGGPAANFKMGVRRKVGRMTTFTNFLVKSTVLPL